MSTPYDRRLEEVTRISGVRGALLAIREDGLTVAEALMDGVDGPAVAALVASLWTRVSGAVDAAGRTSQAFEQLAEAGAILPETSEPCGVVYFTRHYRLLEGQVEPPRGPGSTTGDLGFLKFGVFPGDNGCFSITLCVPEVEEEMRKSIVDPQIFDGVCRQLQGIAPWIDTERAEPTSRVFGMGQLESRWRETTPGGTPISMIQRIVINMS